MSIYREDGTLALCFRRFMISFTARKTDGCWIVGADLRNIK